MNILKKVYLTVESCGMIRPGETVLAAVSGGPDSVAMLSILRELETLQQQGWKIVVAHINHQLRGAESDEDEKFVKALAKTMGLPFKSRSVNVAAAKGPKGGLEDTARKLRHRALRDMALEAGAKKIALAHTMDDQAETVMHRIIRGTSLRGLRGVSPIRRLSRKHDLFLVRPMLEMERAEVVAYLKERRLEWREDATNRDTSFTRNRIRHTLLPMVEKEFNPRVKYAIVKLGQTAAAFYLLVREIANEMYENVKLLGKPGEVCLSAEEFSKLPIPVQTLMIDRAIQDLRGTVPQLHFEHYMEIIGLCNEASSGKTIMLPRGMVARRERYVLKIAEPGEEAKPVKIAPTRLKVPGRTLIKRLQLQIEADVLEGKVVGLVDYIRNKDSTEEILDIDRLEGVLKVRQRQDGDTFHPIGGPGRTKLKKFMIDLKVPKGMRDRVPILADDSKIVWVLGYRLADDVKITDGTRRVLRLRVKRLD